jgi:arginine decarboxylase
MIDSSFITTLPDTWAINKFYYVSSQPLEWNIRTRITRWIDLRQRWYLILSKTWMLSICNTIRETIVHRVLIQVLIRKQLAGMEVHHCLIPQPKHILINREKMEL